MKPLFYPNVVLDSSSVRQPEDLVELPYLQTVFNHLEQLMGREFPAYQFYVYSGACTETLPASATLRGNRKVLLYLSEEANTRPIKLEPHYFRVFKTYLTAPHASETCWPFPLGFTGPDWSPAAIPMSARKHSLFFAGNLNRNRLDLFLALSGIPFRPSSGSRMREFLYKLLKVVNKFKSEWRSFDRDAKILFTPAFMGGLDNREYNRLLNTSKIALCPTGFEVNQTYRHYEAMRAGCAVISLKLPDCPYLKPSPIVEVANWDEGLRRARELLQSPEALDRLSREGLKYYREHCHQAAVASYMRDVLQRPTNGERYGNLLAKNPGIASSLS